MCDHLNMNDLGCHRVLSHAFKTGDVRTETFMAAHVP